MIFIGIALLLAAGLALLVNADAGSLIGLSQDQTGHILPLVCILILVAGGAFARRRPAAELIGGILLWTGIFAVAVAGYTYRNEISEVAGRVYAEVRPGIAVIDSKSATATFQRGLGGHFQVNARINGASIPLIFDTGASAMVLTAADARTAGIETSHLQFTSPVSTANGTGRAAIVKLDRIEIGGIVRTSVRAYVTEDGALDTSLLGMTFLETLSRYAVTKDALELTD